LESIESNIFNIQDKKNSIWSSLHWWCIFWIFHWTGLIIITQNGLLYLCYARVCNDSVEVSVFFRKPWD